MQIVIHDNRVVATHADGQGLASLYPGCLILTVPDGTPVAIGQPWNVDLDAARAGQLAAIRAACDASIDVLAAGYPEREVDSWDQQLREANLVAAAASLANDPAEGAEDAIPLLRAMAIARPSLSPDGTTADRVTELARRIRANATAWSEVAGTIIGQRQALEDAINEAATVDAVLTVEVNISLPS